MPYMPYFGVLSQSLPQTTQPSLSHYQNWNEDFMVWEIMLVAVNSDDATANIAWNWETAYADDSGTFNNVSSEAEETLDTFFLEEDVECIANATATATGKATSANTQYIFNPGYH